MLKEYSDAPVHQVTMAVNFVELNAFDTIGLISRCLEFCDFLGDFRLEQSPYVIVQEETEEFRAQMQKFSISHGPPTIGCKLLSKDNATQIEIQNNRFAVLWVKQEGEYPRYKELKPAFLKKFEAFFNLDSNNEISPQLTQCGIQYMNHVDDSDLSAYQNFNFIDFDKFKNHEGLNFSTTQRLDETEEVGRLHMECQTIFRFTSNNDGEFDENRALRFTLTFKGKPQTLTSTGVGKFLDRGHDSIVHTFSSSLSEKGQILFGEKSRE